MAKINRPEIVQLSEAELEKLLAELHLHLPLKTYQLVESLLRTLLWIMDLVERRAITIARLARIIFTEKTEKARKIFPEGSSAKGGQAAGNSKPKGKPKGHGRLGADDYPGAKQVKVPHPLLRVGDICQKCLKGKLYLLKIPARIVRIVARPPFEATVYHLEQLRCALCGALFTAPCPPEAREGKHDTSVGLMLAIQRYGAGQPMYRTAKWQNHFGVPLPASTQWEQIDAASKTPELVYEALLDAAAQGRLLHNDDTHMRVLSLHKEAPLSEEEAPPRSVFTTNIVSQCGEHQVALFFTGQKHAGENLDQVLKRRAADLPKPLQMCDGLSRNHSKQFELILCNCLLHGRRGFVDVINRFPEQGRKVIESLGEVYHFEDLAQEQGLSEAQRLAFHQEHSKPILDQLHLWMKEQLDQKKVEPNSALGQAIRYMLKRWEPLTRFLSVPGAPLDNNLCERALKMAILHRKNSLFYQTLHGARVGDIFMSLIHTCELNHVNPYHYLTELNHHAKSVRSDPTQWLPWNYCQSIRDPTPAEN